MSDRVFTNNLRRKQLDRFFEENKGLRRLECPKQGWIREIRDALGLSAAQLAARMGVRQSTVAKMEKTEQEETISLDSLRRAAEAMDCHLVYALVPRRTLEITLLEQAARRAQNIVGRVEHSMALESQERRSEETEAEIRELAAELARNLSREIWREETK